MNDVDQLSPSDARGTTVREAILDAVERLLAINGYKKMTISDLANEVGIGKGSVYLHFRSKEEIVLSNIDRIVDRLTARLLRIGRSEAEAEDRLREMLCERVMYRFESVQHYTQSLDELLSQVRTKLLERRSSYFLKEAKILAAVIEEGQRTGHFAAGDALDLAKCMVTGTNSLLPYSLGVLELGERNDVRTRTLRTAELLIRGLRSDRRC